VVRLRADNESRDVLTGDGEVPLEVGGAAGEVAPQAAAHEIASGSWVDMFLFLWWQQAARSAGAGSVLLGRLEPESPPYRALRNGCRGLPPVADRPIWVRLRPCPICDRLPPVASAGLHKCSMPVRESVSRRPIGAEDDPWISTLVVHPSDDERAECCSVSRSLGELDSRAA